MSSQPPIISGFQFDENPVAAGIQRLISLLEQLEQRADRATRAVQGGGGRRGPFQGTAADTTQIQELSRTVGSLETNFNRVANAAVTSFTAIQTRIEDVARAMLNLRSETDRTGNELEDLQRRAGGPRGNVLEQEVGNRQQLAQLEQRRADLEDARRRNQATVNRGRESQATAEGTPDATLFRREQVLKTLAEAETKLEQATSRRGRAEAVLRAATESGSVERQIRATQLLTGFLDKESAARDRVGQAQIAAARVQEGLSQQEVRQAQQREQFAEREKQKIFENAAARERAGDQRERKEAEQAAREIKRISEVEAARQRELQKRDANEDAARTRQLQREQNKQAFFESRQPIRIEQAEAGRINALRQQVAAENALAQAQRAEREAQRRGASPEQQAAAHRAVATALQARTAATIALADAERRLAVVSDPRSSRGQVVSAELQARTSRQAATSAAQLSLQNTKLADSFRQVARPAGEAHDRLLALLGVSRFLPGALGQTVSGVALLGGAASSASGIMFGLVGVMGTLAVQLVNLGAAFNTNLNALRAQSEGLGLELETTKALKLILESTGASVENLSIGIRHINEATSNIGPNADRTATALRLAFGDEFQIKAAKSEDILRSIFEALDENSPKFIGAAKANILASEIFQRNFDEIRGRASELNQNLGPLIQQIKATGSASKEAAKEALDQAKAVRELKESFDGLIVALRLPIIATVLIKIVTDPEGITEAELRGASEGAISIVNPVLGFINRKVNALTDEIRATKKFDRSNPEVGTRIEQLQREIQAEQEARKELLKSGASGEQVGLEEELKRRDETILKLTEERAKLITKRKDAIAGIATTEEATTAVTTKISAQERIIAANQISQADSTAVQIAKLETQKQQVDKIIAQKKKDSEVFAEGLSIDEENLTALKASGKTGEELVAAEKQFNVTRNQFETAVREQLAQETRSNALQKQIAELKKEDKGDSAVARLQLEAQNISEDLRDADRASEEFTKLGEKLLKIRQQIIDLAKTADERRRFQRDLARDRSFLRAQTLDEILRKFRDDLREVETSSRETIRNIQERAVETAARTNSAFEAGVIGAKEAAIKEAQAILDVLNAVREATEEQRKLIDGTAADITARIASGDVDPQKGKAALDALKQEKRKNALEDLAAANAASKQRLDLEENEKDRIIENRQELLEVEIRIQESINRRRLELLERAAQDSVDIQASAAQEAADQELQVIRLQRAKVATEFKDRQKAIVAIVTGTGKKGEDIVSGLKVDFPNVLQAGSLEEIRAVGEAINRAIELGADGSEDLLRIYSELVALREEELGIIQKIDIITQDSAITKAQKLVEIQKLRQELARDLLEIEEARLGFLTQEGLISPLESNERQIDIERRRLDLLKRQADEIQREAKIRAAAIAGANERAGRPPQTAIETINASPEITRLNQELLQTQAEALAASDRLVLLDSVLGRVRSGLDILIDALERAPERFDEFSTAIVQRSLRGFADAARGVQKLIEVILGTKLAGKSPAEELQDASKKFNDDVKTSAKDFKEVIKQAAEDFRSIVKGGTAGETGGAAGDAAGIIPSVGAPIKAGSLDTVKKVISKSFTIASGIIDGLNAETIGGKIAGFGSIAAAFGPVGQAVAAVAQIVGGVADFIGAGFRKRAEKLAQDIQSNIDLINQRFRSGALTLGETTQALQKQLESARAQLSGGKIGKKGGKAELAKIEKDVQNQLAQLREQAKQIQDDFIKGLEIQRLAPELRSITQAVADAEKRALEFVRSFETGAEALKHFGEAQEFLNLTLKDLKATAVDQLNAVIEREREASEAFRRARQNIIDQGRVTTFIDQAGDRLEQLFDLERRRAQERAAAESEEAKLRNQINLIDASFGKASDLIDKMRSSFENLAGSLADIFGRSGGGLGGLADGVRGSALEALRTGGSPSSFSGNLNISVSLTAGSPNDAAIRTKDAVEQTLSSLGLVSRVSISRARPVS